MKKFYYNPSDGQIYNEPISEECVELYDGYVCPDGYMIIDNVNFKISTMDYLLTGQFDPDKHYWLSVVILNPKLYLNGY